MSDTPATTSASNKPHCNREDALAVLRRLRESGHVAYFAGGCVRDELLGIAPRDYDIATDAPPQRVRELFSSTQAVGAAFGVILVRHRRSVVEVATFRTDGVYLDGRRPSQVHFASAEEDAKRRDFTINGLFFDPLTNQVIDYVGGQEDLKNRLLRAIGEPSHRFEEDHLRLLRAVRFAARFNLSIEALTAAAIESHAQHLARISPERIADELRQMLTPVTRIAAWRMLWRFGLLQVILRYLPERAEHPIGDAGSRALFTEISPNAAIPFGLALAGVVLCYRTSGNDARSVLPLLSEPEIRKSEQACRKALKLSNDESELMRSCMQLTPLLGDAPPSVAVMKRFLGSPYSAEARLLLGALGRSHDQLGPRTAWLKEQFEAFEQEGDIKPVPLITGDDLTAAGLTPGRRFKFILDATYDAQLEGQITGREQAMDMAMRLAQTPSPPARDQRPGAR